MLEFAEFQALLVSAGHPVVVPCLPGYGFSSAPTRPGFGIVEAGVTFHKLMDKLGYDDRFLIQAGDWGSMILEAMVHIDPSRVSGVYSNMPIAPCATLATVFSIKLFDSELENQRLESQNDIGAVSGLGCACCRFRFSVLLFCDSLVSGSFV